MPWSTPLASPIKLKDGRVLVTLRDAGELFASFGESVQSHAWNMHAVELLLEAVEDGGLKVIKAATVQVQRALFREGLL